MIDLRYRNIRMKIGDQWYSVTFQPKIFGRAKNVTVWKQVEDSPYDLFGIYETEVKIPDYTTAEVFKEVLQSFKDDVVSFFLKLQRKRT